MAFVLSSDQHLCPHCGAEDYLEDGKCIQCGEVVKS